MTSAQVLHRLAIVLPHAVLRDPIARHAYVCGALEGILWEAFPDIKHVIALHVDTALNTKHDPEN